MSRALAVAILTPGLTVEEVFKQARVSVLAETGGTQVPWKESSLTGDFFFVTGDQSEGDNAGGETAPLSEEVLFWDSIKDSDNPAFFEAFMQRYPDGVFAAIAAAILEEIQEAEDTAQRNAEENQVAAIAPEVPEQVYPFDGAWELVVGSKTGCGDNSRTGFTAHVFQGQIDQWDAQFGATGTISADGTFNIEIRDGSTRAVLVRQTGKIVDDLGQGRMQATRRTSCTGVVILIRLNKRQAPRQRTQ